MFAFTLPAVLRRAPNIVSVSFRLRDCPFVDFQTELDLEDSTVYDLVNEVSKHHGRTVESDKVQIFVKASEHEFDELTNPAQRLSPVAPADNVFYYDFRPIRGSLLSLI
jgi:hypothetical protein